ncbi:MAG: restriction endonuclease subunit S [Leptothrix sp. (in: b-proteobacteria)]
MSFPKYPAYKDSGVEWLGEVPAHWEVKCLKHVIANIGQGWSPQCEGFPVSSDDEWGVLKVGCVNGGQFRPDENKRLPDTETPIPELGIVAGDMLISRANTRELVGSAAVVPADYPRLLLCDKLYRLRFKNDSCLPKFAASFLATDAVRAQIELAASGASSSMLNIAQSTILELKIALPEVTEQEQISEVLAVETAKIDALVAEQEKLIALLKEKRQAVISHAVTKGMDPSVPMKDSGVEWLGEVPAHWEVTHIKRMTSRMTDGAHISPETDGGIFDFVSTKDVVDDEIDFDGALKTSPASYEYLVRTGC